MRRKKNVKKKKIKNKNSQNELNKKSLKSNNEYSLHLEEDTEEQNKNHKKFKRKIEDIALWI